MAATQGEDKSARHAAAEGNLGTRETATAVVDARPAWTGRADLFLDAGGT